MPAELRQRLEGVARRQRHGKNWIIVRAIEQYLDKAEQRDLAEEARRQSLLASGMVTPDEEFWQSHNDDTDWSS